MASPGTLGELIWVNKLISDATGPTGLLTISLCGLGEADSSGVDVVHVVDGGTVRILRQRVLILQHLRDGLHGGGLTALRPPAVQLEPRGEQRARSDHITTQHQTIQVKRSRFNQQASY